MKILKIEKFEQDKIVVTVEGYEHAQPVFNSNISEEDLKNELKKWKINQDEIDLLNSSPIEKQEEKFSTPLQKLVGQIIK